MDDEADEVQGTLPGVDPGEGRDPATGAAAAPGEAGFTGKRAAQVAGISYRQLDYWARTHLIRPSLADAQGSGSRRLYSYRDLLELRVIKNLIDAGIKLETVREVFAYLRAKLGDDLASAHLVISGSTVVLCDGDELIDAVRRGQGVLNVLPLAGVKHDVDSAIVHLRPTTGAGERPSAGDAAPTGRRSDAAEG
jgi:DNA-binding transcriptional MerR regulator